MNYRDFIADPARECAIVAHRGIWREAPENSLLAIQRAIDAGYDVVEIDVRRCSDGGLVLLHDDTLQRTAGVEAAPESLSSRELSALCLRNRDGGVGNAFTNERLPRLAEVFELTRGRIFLHLDIKERDIIPDVIACARLMGVEDQVDFWAALKTTEDFAWIRATIAPHDVLFMAKTRLNVPDAATQLALLSGSLRDLFRPSRTAFRSRRPVARQRHGALGQHA